MLIIHFQSFPCQYDRRGVFDCKENESEMERTTLPCPVPGVRPGTDLSGPFRRPPPKSKKHSTQCQEPSAIPAVSAWAVFSTPSPQLLSSTTEEASTDNGTPPPNLVERAPVTTCGFCLQIATAVSHSKQRQEQRAPYSGRYWVLQKVQIASFALISPL